MGGKGAIFKDAADAATENARRPIASHVSTSTELKKDSRANRLLAEIYDKENLFDNNKQEQRRNRRRHEYRDSSRHAIRKIALKKCLLGITDG